MICLKPISIFNIPIERYEDNFLFIVNGVEFKTNIVLIFYRLILFLKIRSCTKDYIIKCY